MHLNQSRYGWSKVALLYDNNESLLGLRELLHMVGTQVACSDLPPLLLSCTAVRRERHSA